MKGYVKYLSVAVAMALGSASAASAQGNSTHVTRATLNNGLRVVIVRDTLAPVVTTSMNYLAGSDEAPAGFPGTAHAVEHMMFRGSPGLSKDQLFAIGSDMGGVFDAFTHAGYTQFVFNLPAQDLNVALHIAAIRMRGVDMTPKGWKSERGAIEQEVSHDTSNPLIKFQLRQLKPLLFAGTPYAHGSLGTRPSFNKTTAAMLRKFHDTWYAPNNAILVIAGDVDPTSALKQIRTLFGSIPRRTLPQKPSFRFQPTTAKTVHVSGNLPVGVDAIYWRMPGSHSKDYATALVLAQAMGSKRGKLFSMGLTGEALLGRFTGAFLPHAGEAAALGLFRSGSNPYQLLDTMQDIMAHVARDGVPPELVKAAKGHAIADLGYKKNSIRGFAMAWSNVLATGRGRSPDAIRTAIAAVTPAQVNALAERIFKPGHAITLIFKPKPSGKPVSTAHFGGAETFGGSPSGTVSLPGWAQAAFAKLTLPAIKSHPTSYTLANGLRLIV